MRRVVCSVALLLLCLFVAVESSAEETEIRGTCAYIDGQYGVVVSSITARDLRVAGLDMGDEAEVMIGSTTHIVRLDYLDWDIPEGTSVAYVAWGDLRFWRRGGNLAADFNVMPGDPITLRLVAKAKFPRTDPVDRYWEDIPIDVESLPSAIEPVETEIPALHVVGSQIMTDEATAVVLRGAAVEDPFWADFDGAPVLRRDLAMIKAWGGNVLHVPVHPEAWKMQGALPYLEHYLDVVVQWAGEVGLYTIISWKTHGNPETKRVNEQKYDPDMVLARQALATLARRYQQCRWVLYSVFNESNSFMRWDRFEVCMTALVDAVRSESPDALVLVPGVDVASDLSDIPSHPVPRENIVYAADVYPWVWDKTMFREDALALLEAGYPLLIFEWGFDVREDESRFPYCCQYATPESLGQPLLSFCADHGISWTAWVWSNDWCPHMFYDYERLELTPFGEFVRDELLIGAAGVPPAMHHTPTLRVGPEQARAEGCDVLDRLAGEVGPDRATILEARATAEWAFAYWEGPVDLPLSPIVSLDLEHAAEVTAVFTESPCAPTADPAGMDAVLPVDGFSEGSEPLEGWWYTFSDSDTGREFSELAVEESDESPRISYRFPDDGNALRATLQFRDVFDASDFDGMAIVCQAVPAGKFELRVGYADPGIPPEPEDEIGYGEAGIPCSLFVAESITTFRIPFQLFAPHEWLLAQHKDASEQLPTDGIWEIKLTPEHADGVLEILSVSFYRESR